MIYLVIILFALGVFLSAFFSGSETGFYRASRIRFVMDGIDGDWFSRNMVWLFNNPTLFVATTLVGNNVANYLVSLAIVLGVGIVFQAQGGSAEVIAPIVLAPALFVYGELLPKSMFFLAPNSMLRKAAPLFQFFTVLLAPVSAVLWSLARLLEKMLGQSPEKVRLALARHELQDVLAEGQEVGLLHPSQRLLSQNFFLVVSNPLGEVCTPLSRVKSMPMNSTHEQLLKFARRNELSEIVLYEKNRTQPVGYVRTVDLLVKRSGGDQPVHATEFFCLKTSELFGEALLQMQANRETVALVVSGANVPVGILSINQLTDPLLKGPLGSLRR